MAAGGGSEVQWAVAAETGPVAMGAAAAALAVPGGSRAVVSREGAAVLRWQRRHRWQWGGCGNMIVATGDGNSGIVAKGGDDDRSGCEWMAVAGISGGSQHRLVAEMASSVISGEAPLGRWEAAVAPAGYWQ